MISYFVAEGNFLHHISFSVVCGNVLAICKCSSHIISFDLTNYKNTDNNYILTIDTILDLKGYVWFIFIFSSLNLALWPRISFLFTRKTYLTHIITRKNFPEKNIKAVHLHTIFIQNSIWSKNWEVNRVWFELWIF